MPGTLLLPLLSVALGFLPSRALASFEDLGAGARAPGMGNAFAAVADDVYAIYYNPAGLGLLSRPEVATAYTRHLMGLTDGSSLATSFIGFASPLAGGRWGTAGAAWQQFSLNTSLYTESAFYLSYGRLVAQDLGPGDLYAGANAKYLHRSFGTFPEATSAMSGLFSTGRADPVLARNGVTVPDADLGLLYRLKAHYSIGLAVLHALSPNVAFSPADSDRLPPSIKLGLGYRSILSNLGVEYDTRRSPIGTQDQILTLSGERWLRTLFSGDFGFRGGLSLGSRDLLEAAAGVSYHTRRLAFDYGFAMPFNSISSTAGSHRLGVSMRFGSLQEPDESVLMVLEAMQQLKSGQTVELRAMGFGLTPAQKAALDEFVAQSRSLQLRAQYKSALDKLSQALAVSPGDTQLLKNFGRLNFVAQYVTDLPEYKSDPVQAALHQGIVAYLAFNDKLAVEKVAYALSLNPSHRGLDGFLAQLEMATGLKRPSMPAVQPARYRLEQLVTRASAALDEGKYDEAVSLSDDILKEDPNNITAWENLGTAYFAVGDYRKSYHAWEKAYAMEESPARRSLMDGYLKSLRKLMERRPAAAAPAVVRQAASPQDIQRLYNEGVDFYTGGRLEDAKRRFEEVLDLDPAYVPATKALRRVMEELSQQRQ